MNTNLAPAAICCVLKRIFDLRRMVQNKEFDEKTVVKLEPILARVSFEEELTGGDFEKCWAAIRSLAKTQMDDLSLETEKTLCQELKDSQEENQQLRAAIKVKDDALLDAQGCFDDLNQHGLYSGMIVEIGDALTTIDKLPPLTVDIVIGGGTITDIEVPRGVLVRVTDMDQQSCGEECQKEYKHI